MAFRDTRRIFQPFPPSRLHGEHAALDSFPPQIGYWVILVKNVVEINAAALESDHEIPVEGSFAWHGLTPGKTGRRIESFRPDMLGVRSVFPLAFPVVRAIRREAKKTKPDVNTVTGGRRNTRTYS